MSRVTTPAALAAGCLLYHAAHAHGVAGPRIFVNTLILDDPAVADEAALPTISWQRPPNAGESYDADVEFDKRITKRFGIGINDGYSIQTLPGAKNATGWQNVFLTLKYQAYINPDHEFMAAIGVIREFPRTGSPALGNDDVGTTTPTLYWGKGFGDLPIGFLRPLAVTGTIGYQYADKRLGTVSAPESEPGAPGVGFNNGVENRWVGGLSVQYSLPYLQSQVRDIGLPALLAGVTPLVELAWSSPASRPHAQGTQVLFGVGAIYTARTYAVGVEALIPANGQTGRGIGAIAQLHWYFDDLFPNTLGKPVLSW